ncbi:hypothetical protein TcasGA2_TC001299 [Tribolium castaneum]|uniref:Uncharacterized protein n=1 Tax=Tribolium castaneum TaxID=7070 RepID=D6WBS4_TRICA|nr:hypothetical protein TcasGA2_TC001299 [Tribolium castaneum]
MLALLQQMVEGGMGHKEMTLPCLHSTKAVPARERTFPRRGGDRRVLSRVPGFCHCFREQLTGRIVGCLTDEVQGAYLKDNNVSAV